MTHPHHMPVRELFVSPDAAAALRAEAARLPAWTLDPQQAGELALLLNGGFAPLRGYMTQADFTAASDGAVAPWPVPLALRVDADFAGRVQPGDDIALRDAGGQVLAIMSITDHWGDPVRLGGKVKGLRRPDGGTPPNETRALFHARGAARVLAVQPQAAGQVEPAWALAQRLDAALLIQPFPGVTVAIPAGAVLSPLPVAPTEGPRAVLWQALVARNHGATHVVAPGDAAGRDLLGRHQDSIGVAVVVADPIA